MAINVVVMAGCSATGMNCFRTKDEGWKLPFVWEDQELKVFVSHANSDKSLVDALRILICGAFAESVELKYSSASVAAGGIAAGQSWLDWIKAQVQESIMTIVVLTPFSKARPWLMWEAGAVSGLGLSKGASIPVVPLLFGLKSDEVPSPLRERQTKSGLAGGDIRDLLESLRLLGQLTYQSESHVQSLIDSYLKKVYEIRVPGMYDLFISCPMSSITGLEYEEMRDTVMNLFEAVTARGYSVYSALQKTEGVLAPETIAAREDFEALKSSRNFLMIYPRSLLSSCLLEAGYALVNGTPSTYFVRNDEDLPYMLRGAIGSGSFSNVQRFNFRNPGDIVGLFLRYPTQFIP